MRIVEKFVKFVLVAVVVGAIAIMALPYVTEYLGLEIKSYKKGVIVEQDNFYTNDWFKLCYTCPKGYYIQSYKEAFKDVQAEQGENPFLSMDSTGGATEAVVRNNKNESNLNISVAYGSMDLSSEQGKQEVIKEYEGRFKQIEGCTFKVDKIVTEELTGVEYDVIKCTFKVAGKTYKMEQLVRTESGYTIGITFVGNEKQIKEMKKGFEQI